MSNVTLLKCEICDLEFDSKKQELLAEHQKLKHDSPCNCCKLKFVSTESLESHKEKSHPVEYHQEKVADIMSLFQNKGGAVSTLFGTRKPRYDIINSWADHLEKLIDLGVLKEEKGNIATHIKQDLTRMGVHPASIDYVHRVLPYKYKNASQSRSQNPQDSVPRNSSEQIADVKEENAILLSWCNRRVQFFQWLQTILESNHYWAVLDQHERNEFEQFLFLEDVSFDVAKDSFDSRQSVPVKLQLMLVSALSSATINHSGGFFLEKIKIYGSNKKSEAIRLMREIAFYKLIQEKRHHNRNCYISQLESEKIANLKSLLIKTPKDFKNNKTDAIKKLKEFHPNLAEMIQQENFDSAIEKIIELAAQIKQYIQPIDELTSKQTGKTMAGFIKRVHKVLTPKKRDEAINADFLGIQCPNCGGYNVGEKQENENDPNSFRPFCFACEEFFDGKTLNKCKHCHFPFYDEILSYMLQTAEHVDEKFVHTSCPNSSCKVPLIIARTLFPDEPSVPQMRQRILEVIKELEEMPKLKIITSQLIADKLDSALASKLKPSTQPWAGYKPFNVQSE